MNQGRLNEAGIKPGKLYKVPTTNTLISRVSMEVLALLVFGYPMLHIYVFLKGNAEPYRRGFFCDDETLKHPDLQEEISVGSCVAIWIAIVFVIVTLVEILYSSIFRYEKWEAELESRRCDVRCLSRFPWVAVELYRILGYCGFGGLASLLTTELAKYKIGRLRPYFLTVCDPDFRDLQCKDDLGYEVFVTDYECRGDRDEVREAMKSFMSGHSSFSFYCAIFLVIYLHARLSSQQTSDCVKRRDRIASRIIFRGIKVLRPFLQFSIVSLAIYIALTRISDYKHHPADVITGILVGTFFAILILLFQVDLFRKPRSFRNFEHDHDCAASARGDVGNLELGRREMTSSGNENRPSSSVRQPFPTRILDPTVN